MDYKDIVSLIKLVGKSDLAEVKIRDGEFEISIRTDKYVKGGKDAGAAPAIVPVPQPHQVIPTPSAPPAPPISENLPADKPEKEPESKEATNNLLEVRSPIVGTFYRSPAPDKPPYIKVGDTINVGDVVCIVEAMKLFNEIESEVSGKIVKVVTDDASPVEYDQVLFLVDPNA